MLPSIKMDSLDPRPALAELQERIRSLTEENGQLRDKHEVLFTKVGYLESRLAHMAASKTDLSSKLVQSEEEKLKISKELVEAKIETNKLREHFEEETFVLKNKILNQEGMMAELGSERDTLRRELQSTEARLQLSEKTGGDLREEYVALKGNYLALAEAHETEVARGEELSAELLDLAQTQDTLRMQLAVADKLEQQQQSVRASTQGLHGELDRVRALVSRMSHNRVKPEDLAALDHERKSMEKNLLGNQDEIKAMLEKMKKSYEEQQEKLEEKVVAMAKEQWDNRRAIHNNQQKLSEQSTALMCSQSQLKEVEEENSKLQLQVKELNEEYRTRLVCYLQDIAEYMDGFGAETRGKGPAERGKMRAFVDSMLQDVRSSYRAREEQLATAARSYKKRLQRMTKTHHALVIAYRVQREQILSKPETGLDPGPPEDHFNLETSELKGETEREVQRLRQDKARLEGQLRVALQEQQVAPRIPVQTIGFHKSGKPGHICAESWLDIRKQIQDITNSTLGGFERERAQLITRATVAEAQVFELQDYVDNHLGRYKQEITRLRRVQGVEEAGGRAQSAEAATTSLTPRRSLKKSSYEI